MKLTALKCPNCGGVIDNAEGLAAFFCKYCGHKIIIEDLTEAEINANIALQNMAHEEKMQQLRNEAENAKAQNKKGLKDDLVVLLWIGMMLAFILIMAYIGMKYGD